MDTQAPSAPEVLGDNKQPLPTTVEVKVEFGERISRLFIFRCLWMWVMVWPLLVWCVWVGLLNFVHFWYMLLLGKRSKTIWDSVVRFHRHVNKWQYYFKNLTNKRPKFIED